MKKLKIWVAVGLMLAVPALLGSCDSDPWYGGWDDGWTWGNNYNNRPSDEQVSNEDFFVAMAQTLAGQWRGNMMAYALDANGTVIDSMAYSTDIEFKQYNAQSISGTGTQYDFNPTNDKLELQRNFTWYINPQTGNIYLTYKEVNANGTTSDYVMTIAYDDLNLNNRSFTGYLQATNGNEVDDFWFNRYAQTRASRGITGIKKIVFVKK